jgi:DNA-binding transcriptional ArsR family regulator
MTDRADAVFSALADATRRDVVGRLAERGALTATEIAAELPVSRQAVAKHLAALADAGLVAATREGREVRYRFTPGPMAEAVGWMAEIGSEWDARLDALKRHLARRPPR